MRIILKKIKDKRGFAILLAVTLASILLSISLSIANIVFKELTFGISARDANDAFFAADTGAECALFNDKPISPSTIGLFPVGGPAVPLSCALLSITPIYSPGSNTGLYTFIVTGLGSSNASCAKVTVFKDAASNSPYTVTTVTSKGYNVGNGACDSANPNRVEREIKISY